MLALDTNTGASRHLEILRTNALSGELEHRLLVQDNNGNQGLATINDNLIAIRDTVKSVNPTIYTPTNVIDKPADFTIDVIVSQDPTTFPSQLVDVSHLQHVNIDYIDNFVLEDPNNLGDVLLENNQTLPSNGTHTVEVVGRINGNYNAINADDYTQPSYNAINPWHTLTGQVDADGNLAQITKPDGQPEDINVLGEVVLANFSPTPKLSFTGENSHYLPGLDVRGISQIYFRTNAGSMSIQGGSGVLFDKLHTTQANDPRIDADPNFVPEASDVQAYVLGQF